jgi:hypothetical protein
MMVAFVWLLLIAKGKWAEQKTREKKDRFHSHQQINSLCRQRVRARNFSFEITRVVEARLEPA